MLGASPRPGIFCLEPKFLAARHAGHSKGLLSTIHSNDILISFTTVPLTCPTGWLEYGDNCYLQTAATTTFDLAQTECEGSMANLVTVQSEDEWTFVKGEQHTYTSPVYRGWF